MHYNIYLSFLCFFYCLFYEIFTFRRVISSACLFIFSSVSNTSSSFITNLKCQIIKILQQQIEIGMTSALQLQKKLQILLDEVKDIFHATSINIEALGVQMQHKNTPKQVTTILDNCNSNLNELKKLLDERSTLRLNYLITQQIKQEEAKVRRERLNEYQQKILDQRRLISDKQTFYQNLLRPKKKRPAHMTVQQFQDVRRKQIAEEQNRKFNMLKNQVTKLDEFYKLIKNQNDKIQQALNGEKILEEQAHKRQDIADEIKNSQVLYNSLNQSLASAQKTQMLTQLFKSIQGIKIQNESLMKEYLQQKQMEQYLRWEKKKLIQQYKTARDQLSKCREGINKKTKPAFERSVSR